MNLTTRVDGGSERRTSTRGRGSRTAILGASVLVLSGLAQGGVALAADTDPGGPARATNVSTQCFHVGVTPGGYPALKGDSYFTSSLASSDRGFRWLESEYAYGLRLRGTVYKKTVWSSTDHYWYFVPHRFAVGGNGTVNGGGLTVATSGANPTGQALGSRTIFSLQSTKTDVNYSLSVPWGVSGGWDTTRTVRKIPNTVWTSAGRTRTSGLLTWNEPLSGSASRDSGLDKISVKTAAAPGADGADAWAPSVTWNKPDFYRSTLNRATPAFSGLLPTSCSSVRWTTERTVTEKPDAPAPGDTTAPTLTKPVAALTSPTSRSASFQISATDDSGVPVPEMRVRVSGETTWRPWVPYTPTGTVILPDRYGDFTIWFQVRDAAGNLSSERAADNVTRVQDLVPPTVTGAGVALGDPASRYVSYSLSASDSLSPITQMRLLVSGEDWRPWVPYSPNGTVVLPDGYGRFGVSFQVMDSAGNVSAPHFAGAVTRTAPVSLGLHQIDNSGNLRSCGSEAQPCTDIVKRFRVNISSPVLPRTDLLFKAWRNVNGVWVETSTSPFMRLGITGSTIDFGVSANLLAGVWRFQAQVPRDVDGVTDFAASGYQFLRIG